MSVEVQDAPVESTAADEVLHLRGVAPLQFLERSEGDDRPRATGYPVVFNEWTEIRSFFEGNFMERIAPGAVKKTIKDMGDRIKVLFQHGRDQYIGNKPLGPHDVLREEGDKGVYAEVPLIDADYNRETLLPGLRAGLYGWSFRFEMVRFEDNEDPGASDHNPKGLMERTIRELRMPEISVVTFPQYNTSVQMRSLDDDFLKDELFNRFVEHDPERLRSLLSGEDEPEPNGDAPSSEQVEERRVEGPGDSDQEDLEETVPTTVRTSRGLLLPTPLPRRGGVLPNIITTEEEAPWRPLRLP